MYLSLSVWQGNASQRAGPIRRRGRTRILKGQLKKAPRPSLSCGAFCWGYGVLRLWRLVEALVPRSFGASLSLRSFVDTVGSCWDLWEWQAWVACHAIKTMSILAFAPTDRYDDDYGYHQNVDRTYLSHSLFFLLTLWQHCILFCDATKPAFWYPHYIKLLKHFYRIVWSPKSNVSVPSQRSEKDESEWQTSPKIRKIGNEEKIKSNHLSRELEPKTKQ